jgi:hypothetical protein
VERDPDNFRNPDGSVKWEPFEKFCKDHPQLVRRLYAPPLPYDLRREYPKFRCSNARELIAFLEDNKDVPSLFVEKADDAKGWEQGKRKPDELDRFPLLPPAHANAFDPDEWTQEKLASARVPDEFDAYMVARAWYNYAQEPLPPPGRFPGTSEPIRDRLREHLPRHMSTIIFRNSPCLAQNFVAQRLQDEGWFDAEPFALTNWFKEAPRLSSQEQRQREAVGEKRDWAVVTWGRAQKMWKEHGRRNHLWFEDPADQKNMEDKAAAFAKKFNVPPGMVPPRLDEAKLTKEDKEGLNAVRFLGELQGAKRLTNFDHFLTVARVEGESRTATARKLLYQAEQLRLVDQAPLKALAKYEDPRALATWRKVMEENADFGHDPDLQEQAFEMELKYVRLYRKVHGANLTHSLALESFLGEAAAQAPLGMSWPLLDLYSRPLLLVDASEKVGDQLAVAGPLGDIIPQSVKDTVLVRRDLKKPTGPPAGMTPPAGMPQPPGGRPPQPRGR